MRATAGMETARQPSTPIAFAMPAGACDCHTHIHGPVEQYPYADGRFYTPPAALPDEMAALHRALGIDRVVIVTPSVYGTDNRATLWGVAARGQSARAVIVMDDATSDADLDAMGDAGAVGIRLNFATGGMMEPAVARQRFQAAVARVAPRGWHVQMFTTLPVIAALADLVGTSPVPVVFDHFGGAKAVEGVGQVGFATLVDLVGCGAAYVKVSGAYRASALSPDYADCTPLARALIAANAARILWGTDWPHPDSARVPGRSSNDMVPFLDIDDAALLNQLRDWAPDAAMRQAILVDNPARLYGF